MRYLFLLLLFSISVNASEDPLLVSGESVEVNAPEQKRTITTNVVLDQGTLHLEGDVLVQYLEGEETVRVVVNGEPTTFKGIVEGETEISNGTASEIVYLPNEKKVLMTDFVLTDPAGNTQKGKSGTFIFE